MENRKIAERYARAVQTNDLGLLGELTHADIAVRYPQSGELIRGRDNYLGVLSNYQSGLPVGAGNCVVPDQAAFRHLWISPMRRAALVAGGRCFA